jgi:hypothetical protein
MAFPYSREPVTNACSWVYQIGRQAHDHFPYVNIKMFVQAGSPSFGLSRFNVASLNAQDIPTHRANTDAMINFPLGCRKRTSIKQQHPLLTMFCAGHGSTDLMLTIHKTLISLWCIQSSSFLQGCLFLVLDESYLHSRQLRSLWSSQCMQHAHKRAQSNLALDMR